MSPSSQEHRIDPVKRKALMRKGFLTSTDDPVKKIYGLTGSSCGVKEALYINGFPLSRSNLYL